ncbi:hypothetical protein, partial [Bacillus amyloliquefaciens]|uniref:hypothetical protein n=1 Tax=Bacillus amyloliquefaciens TaxID=1390 RepID=UPI00197AA7BD
AGSRDVELDGVYSTTPAFDSSVACDSGFDAQVHTWPVPLRDKKYRTFRASPSRDSPRPTRGDGCSGQPENNYVDSV